MTKIRFLFGLILLLLFCGTTYSQEEKEIEENRVKSLIVDLRNKDINVRNKAIAGLVGIGSPAVEDLLTLLEDKNLYVQMRVCRALGRIGDSRAVRPLLLIAGKGKKEILPTYKFLREEAHRALSEIGKSAVRPLIVALRYGDDNLRKEAVKVLEEVGWSPESISEKISYLFVAEDWNGLAYVGEPAVEYLITALKDEKDWLIRRDIIRTLGKIGDKRTVEPLSNVLKNENEYVKKVVAQALGEIGDVKAVKPLLSLCSASEKSEVRKQAENAILQIGKPGIPALMSSLENEDAWARSSATSLISRIAGPEEAIELLATFLKYEPITSDRYSNRLQIVEYLSEIGGRGVVEILTNLLDDTSHYVRKTAAKTLIKIVKPGVEPLIPVLKNKSWYLRYQAATLLGEIGDTKAVEPLIALLEDYNTNVRIKAVHALGEIRDKRAVEPLIMSLKDRNEGVRRSAIWALGKIGDKKAVEPLIAILLNKYGNPDLYEAAIALGKIGDKRAIEPLFITLKDVNRQTRLDEQTTIAQLEKIGWSPQSPSEMAWYLWVKGRYRELEEMGELAIEPLISALKWGGPGAQSKAMESLVKVGKPAVESLMSLLRDKNRYTRLRTVEILDNIGDKRAIESLKRALRREKEFGVKNAIQQALSKLEKEKEVE